MSRQEKIMHIKTAALTWVIVMILILPGVTAGQEVQIPIDDEARLERITPELNRELGLFPEYPDFLDARLFQVSDSLFKLEIEYLTDGRRTREQRELNHTQMREFRQRVSGLLKQHAPHALVDREGRTEFVVGTTLLSLGFYGWAIPSIAGIDDSRAAIGSYMLIGGAGFLIPHLATKDARVTDGMATLGIQGGIRGILDGYLLYSLISPNGQDDQAMLATMAAMSIGELIVGYVIADNTNMSGGSAGAISIGGNFGLGVGLGTALLIDEDSPDGSLMSALGLLGTGAGYFIGSEMAGAQHYTQGDATVLANMGILGAIIPPAIISATDSEDEKLYVGAAMAGSIGALVLGHSMLANRDFTRSQGTFTTLGTLAGGLFGLGIATVATEDNSDGTTYLILGSLGAAAGFALMYSSYSEEAEAAASSFSWDINVSPLGLMTTFSDIGLVNNQPPPFLMISARF